MYYVMSGILMLWRLSSRNRVLVDSNRAFGDIYSDLVNDLIKIYFYHNLRMGFATIELLTT